MTTLVKEEIRPLLAEELKRALVLEEKEYLSVKSKPEGLGWQELAKLDEAWRAARLRRAQVELQLWLADRQWEREESENQSITESIHRAAAFRTIKP